MEQIVLIYLLIGGMSIFMMVAFILVIAGKDILFALFRRFTTKYNDVFVVNPNKQISHYYKKSKDGIFRVDGKIYITNPHKLLGLGDRMINEIRESMSLNKRKLQHRIDKLDFKADIIKKQIKSLADIPENSKLINEHSLQLTEINNSIELLKSKLIKREQNYWLDHRGAYFYIENDPVPKDFFELYTEMDSVQLENVIIRAQTKDPKGMADLDSQITWIKRFTMFALIAAAVAAFFAFKSNSMLTQLGDHLGVTFTI